MVKVRVARNILHPQKTRFGSTSARPVSEVRRLSEPGFQRRPPNFGHKLHVSPNFKLEFCTFIPLISFTFERFTLHFLEFSSGTINVWHVCCIGKSIDKYPYAIQCLDSDHFVCKELLRAVFCTDGAAT